MKAPPCPLNTLFTCTYIFLFVHDIVYVQSASPGGEVVGGLELGHPAKGVEPLWQRKNEEVMEQDFQKDLEVHQLKTI